MSSSSLWKNPKCLFVYCFIQLKNNGPKQTLTTNFKCRLIHKNSLATYIKWQPMTECSISKVFLVSLVTFVGLLTLTKPSQKL